MNKELEELKTKMTAAMAYLNFPDQDNTRLKRIETNWECRDTEVLFKIGASRNGPDDWLILVTAQKGPVFVDADYVFKNSGLTKVTTLEQAISESSDMLGNKVAAAFIQCCYPEADVEGITNFLRSSLRERLSIDTSLWDGWDDDLDDPKNLADQYDPDTDDIRYGPGFTEEEKSHTRILVNNDYEVGQGLSLFRNENRDYAVYPLRSGAFVVRVHNEGDATYAYKFQDEQQFIEYHGGRCLAGPHEQAEMFRFVVSQGGGVWRPPECHVSWYGDVLTMDEGRPAQDDDDDPSPN